MKSDKKFFFFKCYNCGEWYYTKTIINTKKCWKCNHTFTFRNSTKFTKICTIQDAISIIKKLKDKT
ncbi:MAG: DUF1922 domain-containing protein [Candidatus Thorarchaeota archaeon]